MNNTKITAENAVSEYLKTVTIGSDIAGHLKDMYLIGVENRKLIVDDFKSKNDPQIETYTPDWEYVTGSLDSSFRMLASPKDKYKEVTINLTPQIRKEGTKEIRGFNYPIAKIDLHNGTFGSASKVFDHATLLAEQIAKRWNEHNTLSTANEQLRGALKEAIQALTDISDPIKYLSIKMPKDGYKFDLSGAVEFSNNGMSVSGMAKDALSKLLTKAKTLIE